MKEFFIEHTVGVVLTFIITLALVFSLVNIIYSLPKTISQEFQGIEFRSGDTDYSEVVSISIEGKYVKHFFQDNYFTGTLVINDVEYSDVKVYLNKVNGTGVAYKEVANSEQLKLTMYTENIEKKIVFCILEPNVETGVSSWSSGNGLIISAPSNNREEALKVAKDLMNVSGELRDLK